MFSISDNGIGMPSTFQNKKQGSLGMSLIAGLSEDLNGSFSLNNEDGTTLEIILESDLQVKSTTTLTPSYLSNN